MTDNRTADAQAITEIQAAASSSAVPPISPMMRTA